MRCNAWKSASAKSKHCHFDPGSRAMSAKLPLDKSLVLIILTFEDLQCLDSSASIMGNLSANVRIGIHSTQLRRPHNANNWRRFITLEVRTMQDKQPPQIVYVYIIHAWPRVLDMLGKHCKTLKVKMKFPRRCWEVDLCAL